MRCVSAPLAGTEDPSNRSGQALSIIAANIDEAASCEGPICQDNGWPTFEVTTPVAVSQIAIAGAIRSNITRRHVCARTAAPSMFR